MAIEFSCACGKQYKLREELAGRKAKCARCGAVLVIPKPLGPEPEPAGPVDIYDVEEPVVPEPQWTVQPSATLEETAATAVAAPIAPARIGGNSKFRDFLYLALLLTLVPLLFTTFQSHQDLRDRLRATIHAHPEVRESVLEGRPVTMHGLLALLPGHKLDGAWLPYDSELHWVFALLAAGAFFGLALVLLPRNSSKPLHAFFTGLFTGTAGVLLLLAVQMIASFMRGRIIIPRSIIGLFVLILKGIQMSYDAANDPNSNFFVSAFGFTFGVGLCEELCKALPVIWHYRTRATLDWRGACLWGFLSGAGFGISEAIMYCGDMYNGISGGDAYLVRFVSCIALHGIWAAAAAIFICKHQNLIQDAENWYSLLFNAMVLVFVPMLLHGFYDTMLKKHIDGGALIVAIISFGWLVWQIEQARRQEASSTQTAYA